MSVAALCLVAGALHAAIPAQRFTLRWWHSIEKIEWDEDYRIVGRRLELVQARIRGSGAGMDPPPDARLVDGAWQYTLADPWRDRVKLARSSYVRDYELCFAGRCRPMSDWIPVSAGSTELRACSLPTRGP
jgi:hypothetical protein